MGKREVLSRSKSGAQKKQVQPKVRTANQEGNPQLPAAKKRKRYPADKILVWRSNNKGA